MENKSNFRSQRVIHENSTHEKEVPQNNIHLVHDNKDQYMLQSPEPSIPIHDPNLTAKLHKQNEKLRTELKQMNQELTSLIERQKYRSPGRETDSGHGKEELKRELENAEKQIQIYSKNFSQLQSRLDLFLSGEKMVELESQLRQKDKDIAKLVQEVKAQEKIIRSQEKALASQMSEDSAANAYLKEVRQLRQKIRELEEKGRQKDKLSQRKHEYYLQIEDKYREISKDNAETAKINLKSPGFRQINTSKSANAKTAQFFKPRSQSKQSLPEKAPKLTEEKFKELQNTINILKKALVTNQGRAKTEREHFNAKVQGMDKKIKELTEKLKEKDRENNIMSNKITELKRAVKSSLVHQIEDSLQKRDETKWEPMKREQPKRNEDESSKRDPKTNRTKRDEDNRSDNQLENAKSKQGNSKGDVPKEDEPLKEEAAPHEKKKKKPKKPERSQIDELEGSSPKIETKTKKKRRNIGIGGLRKEERGKATADTQLFTDQDLFKDKSDWYISGFTVWYSTKCITGIMTHYRDSAGNPIEGSKNVSTNAEGQYKKQDVIFESGDHLKSLTGTFEKTETYVQSLKIVTANGEFYSVGKASETSKPFEFDINEYEYPVVVFGGLELEHDDAKNEIGSKLSKIGVLIKSEAVEEQIEPQEDDRKRLPAKLTQRTSQE